MATELLVYRVFGEPKISKPPILKGIQPSFSQTLNKSKRKCKVFIAGNDGVVYFFDLFSRDMSFPEPGDMALPLPALMKKYPERFAGKQAPKRFIYSDAWCAVLERNEGYVIFKNLISDIKGLHWLHHSVFCDIIPSAISEFVALSWHSPSFERIYEDGGQRSADYCRFVNDMILKIYQMIKDKNL